MKFLSLIKKTLISAFLVLTVALNVSAEFFPVEKELSEYGSNIYSAARADFGRSFNGYCGTYIRCQLKAMGIFDGQYDFFANGNQWYDVFNGVSETSGGYSVLQEGGSDCLDKLVEKHGNDLKNILVSFPIQANYSAKRPGAGHAVFIHRIVDGIAYYSESFSFSNFREGQIIAEDVSSLMNRYQRNHGSAKGCVLFEKNESTVLSSGFNSKQDIFDDVIEKIMKTSNCSTITLC